MRKVASNILTIGLLTSDFIEKLEDLISIDRCLTFMNGMKGNLAYWKKFFFNAFAMVKHPLVPTFL